MTSPEDAVEYALMTVVWPLMQPGFATPPGLTQRVAAWAEPAVNRPAIIIHSRMCVPAFPEAQVLPI